MADRKTAPVYRTRGPVDDEDWTAVAVALNERMARRRIGQQDLARLSGVSVSTLRELQHGAGRRVQNKTLASIARALEWPDDHLIQVLLATGSAADPEPAEPTGREILTVLTRVEDRLTEILTRLAAVEHAVSAAHDSAPPDSKPDSSRRHDGTSRT
ncbi:helix-turn-helix transcriptional regulator [Parafrankia sp. EUN1f]|uniref:helix-turn-helix domain-containing protein n=1 Tax=Parafrankia sp. EUN1f TaxID=102897 RepID=UPI0001C43DC8|nr:helix-turn-helix domain-containing protein [Parafrankia sp. EUN1f]EFC85955.1 transcriptional regulator, XRE family [Parafrankia sp. EUN1f]